VPRLDKPIRARELRKRIAELLEADREDDLIE